jgi:hypothetical protein
MGKRELVLIALFVVAGIVIFQVTAPPAPAGSDVSVGGIFQRMRRTIQGSREQASADRTQTYPVEGDVKLLRVNLPRPCNLTITGGDGNDIGVELHVVARGFSQAEAKAAAEGAAVKIERAGDAMVAPSIWNMSRSKSGDAFLNQVTIALTVPRRMAVRLEPHFGTLTVAGIASLEVMSSRGDTRVTGVPGDIVLTHVAGALEVQGGATLKLTSRNGRGEVSRIAGATRLDLTGAHLKVSEVAGPLEVESRNSELTVDKIAGLKPTLRYNGQGGELRIEGLHVESRIDGRNTDIDVRLDGAAPVTIYNLGAISVTAPPGGYTLDAVAAEGRIESEDSGITATPGSEPDARAQAKIRGGGPTLTLRSTRGRIELRKPAGK